MALEKMFVSESTVAVYVRARMVPLTKMNDVVVRCQGIFLHNVINPCSIASNPRSRTYDLKSFITARKVAFPVTPEFTATPSFARLGTFGINCILRCISPVSAVNVCLSFVLFVQFQVGSKIMLRCERAAITLGVHARRGMVIPYVRLQGRPRAKVNKILIRTW
jgi:hypothetical protein